MNLAREQNKLLRHIKHQHDIFDYYADDLVDDDDSFIAAIGVVVACNKTTFDRLTAYAERHCPNMKITSMTIEDCISRTQNGGDKND